MKRGLDLRGIREEGGRYDQRERGKKDDQRIEREDLKVEGEEEKDWIGWKTILTAACFGYGFFLLYLLLLLLFFYAMFG